MTDLISVVVVVIYCLAMIGVGVWASRRISTTADYLIAGRSLGFWMFTLLMFGSVCSGMSLLGVPGLGYRMGWPTIWEQVFVPLCIGFCIIFFGVKLYKVAKRENYMTVQDYLAKRFQSPRALPFLSALAGIVVSVIYLAGQLTAISIVLVWLFGMPYWQALLIGGFVVTVYTVIGGLWAISVTTLVQSLMIVIGVLIMAPIVINAAGGFTVINEAMNAVGPHMVSPWMESGPVFTPIYLVSFFFLLTIGLACAPHVINNMIVVKDIRYFKWAPVVGFLIYLVIMVLLKYTGFAGIPLVAKGLVTLPDAANAQDYIFLAGVESAMPNIFIWAIFGVIVLAAVMSTTDRLMLTIGSMFSWDIYKNILKPGASDREVLRVSQVAVLVSAIITIILVINPPEILAFLIWMGIGVMLSAFAVPLLAGLYWRRATKEGAIAAMFCGLAFAGIFGYYTKYVEPLPMHWSMYSFIVAIIAMIVVSLLTRPVSEEVLDATLTGPYVRTPK
ncbi:MAG: sodium:solute symporter family protein [Methanospirillaceae archaeon]|nr:sodium:solute symporter family protein [Methanospirillaceae archaeon]